MTCDDCSRGAPSPLLAVEALAFDHTGPFALALSAGECVGLSGPSGSGKTRLLRAMADLDVHRGRMRLDGVDCRNHAPADWRRQVGLLPAVSAWWHERVGPHFATGPSVRDIRALGFEHGVLEWQVDRLSSGERQRLAVLRLLSIRPRVLLLDEPTANLDQDNVLRLEGVIARYQRDAGASALWVGHDAAQLRRVATRAYHLADGQLVDREAA